MLKSASDVFRLEKTSRKSLQTLRDWLGRDDGGQSFLKDNMLESDPWTMPANEHDLIVLDNKEADGFADLVTDHVLAVWHYVVGRHLSHAEEDPNLGKIWRYERATLTMIGNIICMLFSFIIPTVSIFVLDNITTMRNRLIFVSVFIFLFAFTMMFVVGIRRDQVFAATAAFAAIQVVFVGSAELAQSH
jgi:hypothetical protein